MFAEAMYSCDPSAQAAGFVWLAACNRGVQVSSCAAFLCHAQSKTECRADCDAECNAKCHADCTVHYNAECSAEQNAEHPAGYTDECIAER